MSVLKSLCGDIRSWLVGLVLTAIIGGYLTQLFSTWTTALVVATITLIVLLAATALLIRFRSPSEGSALVVVRAAAEGERDGRLTFATALKNVSTRHLCDLGGRGYIVNNSMTSDLRMVALSVADSVPPKQTRDFRLSCFVSKITIEPQFVIMTLWYRSGKWRGRKLQTFCHKFGGVHTGKFESMLYMVTPDEKRKIMDRFERETKRLGLMDGSKRKALDS